MSTPASFWRAGRVRRGASEDRWISAAPAVGRSLAPLLNPYGWRLYEHVWRYLTDSELLARIGEFQSFDFHAAGAAQIIATVILGIAGGTLALDARGDSTIFCWRCCFRRWRCGRRGRCRWSRCAAADRERRDHRASCRSSAFASTAQRLRALDARMSGLALCAPLLIVRGLRARCRRPDSRPTSFPLRPTTTSRPAGGCSPRTSSAAI